MNSETFSEIDSGMTEKQLRAKAGSPYSIKRLGGGEVEYEYIERIKADDRTIESRHYFFIIKNGVITSKKMVYDTYDQPILERNAYDLQSS